MNGWVVFWIFFGSITGCWIFAGIGAYFAWDHK